MTISSFRCDYCDALKTPSNGWYLLIPSVFSALGGGSNIFELAPWGRDDTCATGVKHICSASCAHTALSQWLTEQAQQPQPVGARES